MHHRTRILVLDVPKNQLGRHSDAISTSEIVVNLYRDRPVIVKDRNNEAQEVLALLARSKFTKAWESAT